MKKIKLLTSLSALSALGGGVALTATSCSKDKVDPKIETSQITAKAFGKNSLAIKQSNRIGVFNDEWFEFTYSSETNDESYTWSIDREDLIDTALEWGSGTIPTTSTAVIKVKDVNKLYPTTGDTIKLTCTNGTTPATFEITFIKSEQKEYGLPTCVHSSINDANKIVLPQSGLGDTKTGTITYTSPLTISSGNWMAIYTPNESETDQEPVTLGSTVSTKDNGAKHLTFDKGVLTVVGSTDTVKAANIPGTVSIYNFDFVQYAIITGLSFTDSTGATYQLEKQVTSVTFDFKNLPTTNVLLWHGKFYTADCDEITTKDGMGSKLYFNWQILTAEAAPQQGSDTNMPVEASYDGGLKAWKLYINKNNLDDSFGGWFGSRNNGTFNLNIKWTPDGGSEIGSAEKNNIFTTVTGISDF